MLLDICALFIVMVSSVFVIKNHFRKKASAPSSKTCGSGACHDCRGCHKFASFDPYANKEILE